MTRLVELCDDERMPKKTKRAVLAARRMKKRDELRAQRDEAYTDLRQLNRSLSRLEAQNVEWVRTIKAMRRAKGLLLDLVAKLDVSLARIL